MRDCNQLRFEIRTSPSLSPGIYIPGQHSYASYTRRILGKGQYIDSEMNDNMHNIERTWYCAVTARFSQPTRCASNLNFATLWLRNIAVPVVATMRYILI